MWEMIPKENKIAENSEEVKGNKKQQRGWWMENYDVQGKAEKKSRHCWTGFFSEKANLVPL